MEKTLQITDVRVTNKVSVPTEYVANFKVDETLRGHNRINATFSELIADTKVLNENKYEWIWVADDKLAPKEAGRYEIIRNKDPDGFIRISLKKASDERWAELSKENKLYVSEYAAKRQGRLAVDVVYDDWNDRLDLGAYLDPDNAARVAEVKPEKNAKIASELVDAARSSVAKLDAAVKAGVLTPEVVEPLKNLIRASE